MTDITTLANNCNCFLREFFGRSEGPVFFCSLGNEAGRFPTKELSTRELDKVEDFIRKWDAQGRALYFCVNTLKKGKRRNKANVAELVGLHADLDFRDIVEPRERIEKVLAGIARPPSCTVSSGHGLHCYWLFDEVLPATDESKAHVEKLLKKLADIFAGDPAVCEVARLMRLPGSHNTKNGEWLPVEIVRSGGDTYTIEELEAWLGGAEPVLTSKSAGRKVKASERNAFEVFGEERTKGATQELNDLALAHLSDWVPEIFPKAKPYHGGYRIKSKDLGRELQEDLSIVPKGIKDWGVHDLDDPLEGGRRPVDIVMEYVFKVPVEEIARRDNDAEFEQACDWLRERLPQQEEPAKVVEEKVWPTLAPEALHGLPGKVVKVIGPHTESDPVALLMQFLVSFGNALGRRPYYLIEGDRHYTNLFAVLVGQSSKSRKGTSAGRIRQLMSGVDLDWVQKCIHSGLSSGEGLIWQIRDAVTKVDKEGNEVVEVQGIDDKRLFLDEREFFQALTVMRRDGNTVSRIVRDAWDSRPLASLTKNSPARVKEPHISISAHITEDELRRTLDQTSMANGYANRFLFVCVRRSKELPHGGSLEQSAIDALAEEICKVFSKAPANAFTAFADEHCTGEQITMDAEAHALWTGVYHGLSNGHPGLLGSITGRAEAQTLRLALLYALLDGSNQIKVLHLRAGLALWRYCEDSARYIFGDSMGDPFTDDLLRALRSSGGMTRTEINNMFKRNRSAEKIGAALASLEAYGRARRENRPAKGGGAGRPVEVWVAT